MVELQLPKLTARVRFPSPARMARPPDGVEAAFVMRARCRDSGGGAPGEERAGRDDGSRHPLHAKAARRSRSGLSHERAPGLGRRNVHRGTRWPYRRLPSPAPYEGRPTTSRRPSSCERGGGTREGGWAREERTAARLPGPAATHLLRGGTLGAAPSRRGCGPRGRRSSHTQAATTTATTTATTSTARVCWSHGGSPSVAPVAAPVPAVGQPVVVTMGRA